MSIRETKKNAFGSCFYNSPEEKSLKRYFSKSISDLHSGLRDCWYWPVLISCAVKNTNYIRITDYIEFFAGDNAILLAEHDQQNSYQYIHKNSLCFVGLNMMFMMYLHIAIIVPKELLLLNGNEYNPNTQQERALFCTY